MDFILLWICGGLIFGLIGIVHDMMSKEWWSEMEQAYDVEGKDLRFCKGCLLDVTETMFCSCGEISLSKAHTYSESELEQWDGKTLEEVEQASGMTVNESLDLNGTKK